MDIKKEKLNLISECYSENLSIERSKLCCNIKSTTMTDSAFNEVNLTDAVFRQGEMNRAEFNNMGMSNCAFLNSNMIRSNFTNIGMTGAMFSKSDMDRSDFDEVGIINGIMSSCDLSGLTIRNCKMSGMTIDGYDVLKLIEFYKNNYKGE